MTRPALGTPASGNWLWRPRPSRAARIAVVVFPHAGAGPTVVQPWLLQAPDDVEVVGVQLPGRGMRVAEPPLENVHEIARQIALSLEEIRTPYVLYGHSVGALVAFETARATAPVKLVVSAAPAPHLAPRGAPIHVLPDEAFLSAVKRLGGMPEALDSEAELVALLLPALRADFALRERYVYRPGPPVQCPVVAYAASEDTHVDKGDVEAWGVHAVAEFSFRIFHGNHFFAFTAPRFFAELLAETTDVGVR